jgi:hypothetical protein
MRESELPKESVEVTLARMDGRLGHIEKDIEDIKENHGHGDIWKAIRELRGRDIAIGTAATVVLVAIGVIQWLLNQ